MQQKRQKSDQKRNNNQHKINHEIRHDKVRVVEGLEPGIYDTSYALAQADNADLDLVMITDNADYPVCRIVDYKKFLYQQKKRQKEITDNNKKIVVKEIRFGPNTGEHDVEFKLKHAISFLKDGNRLKAYVFFRGRTIIHKDRGQMLLLKFAQDLEEYGKVVQLPKLEGKKMTMLIEPNKNG